MVSLSHATGTFYGAVLLVLSVGTAVVLYALLRRVLADSKIATMTLVVLEAGTTSVATLAVVFGGEGWLLVLLPAAIGTALAALTLVMQTEPEASPAWPRV